VSPTDLAAHLRRQNPTVGNRGVLDGVSEGRHATYAHGCRPGRGDRPPHGDKGGTGLRERASHSRGRERPRICGRSPGGERPWPSVGQLIVDGHGDVRCIIDDVDASIDFFCRRLGFREQMHPAPTFAMLLRGDLRLGLSAPSAPDGGGQSMPDATPPGPGGWNRFSLEVSDLEKTVNAPRSAGVHYRIEIVSGVGWRRILVEDPSGNPSNCSNPPDRSTRSTPAREITGVSGRRSIRRSLEEGTYWCPRTRSIRIRLGRGC
jgi:catechol 2,3-dioxygenase-like lactoylglutathione lyase family enzyme